MGKRFTCTVMTYTDGHESRYSVMVGQMRGNAFLSGTAVVVATYTLTDEKPDYKRMTACHATTDAPAVPWQTY